jgi:hypothetical protein
MKKALSHITFHAHRRQLPPLYDEETEWYQGWYFDLRLEEEMSRAARYSLPLVVIAIYFGELPPFSSTDFSQLMRQVKGRGLRRSDIPAVRDQRELLVCLTHTGPDRATSVIGRLRRAFGPFAPSIGLASYPDDGSHPATLLAIAENRALCESVSPVPLEGRVRRRRA